MWTRAVVRLLCSIWALLLVVVICAATSQNVQSPTNNPQCIGTFPDLSRLQRLSSDEEDVATFISLSRRQNNRSYIARDVHRVTSITRDACLGERHRMRELVEGIPVFGADFVVRTSSCSDTTSTSPGRSSLVNTNTIATMQVSDIQSVDGYRSKQVDIPTGYIARSTNEEARQFIAERYDILPEKVTELNLEVYPALDRDYLTWIATVLVESIPGEPRVYQVIIDDDNGDLILQCEIAGIHSLDQRKHTKARIRNLRENGIFRVDGSMCNSCSRRAIDVNWNYGEAVECNVQTLYLDNTATTVIGNSTSGQTTLCITGTNTDGTSVVGPGEIPQYFWRGTLNCFGQSWCSFAPIPDCPDAVNDVQFNAIHYLEYLQTNLGIMGGLGMDAGNPIYVQGKTHFEWEYCNAFYLPGEHTVYFGDCNCEQWGPLVSTDVVAHEITHGLTSVSSNLLYFMQSGGLNEAYSDIMACAFEFALDDPRDRPDFFIGESLGEGVLRDMEKPSNDGSSIDDFCAYEGAMSVHFSSGFLNRAYFNAVKSCESTCGTTSECAVLMANMFMYTNLESLSKLSDFKDVAQHTCRNVEEFFEARSPTKKCSAVQAREAIIRGFASVGLHVDAERDCRVSIECRRRFLPLRLVETLTNLWTALKDILFAFRSDTE